VSCHRLLLCRQGSCVAPSFCRRGGREAAAAEKEEEGGGEEERRWGGGLYGVCLTFGILASRQSPRAQEDGGSRICVCTVCVSVCWCVRVSVCTCVCVCPRVWVAVCGRHALECVCVCACPCLCVAACGHHDLKRPDPSPWRRRSCSNPKLI